MKLGTVVYANKIYNLDYMSIEEMKELLQKIIIFGKKYRLLRFVVI